MKKIWILMSRMFGYNQVKENKGKGYITFQKIHVSNQNKRY